tara:strand:- start:109 stop:537 length:429 start_codon:yes stop_codon:yes gene_type:complete
MNLFESIPRSPKVKMEGLVMIFRMIDKARAYNSNTLGEYIFPCPLDKIILGFLNTNHKKFAYQTQNLSDKGMASWIGEKCLHRSKDDKERINKKILDRKPDTPESLNRFDVIRNKINPIAENVTTWVELIELEESHPLQKIT